MKVQSPQAEYAAQQYEAYKASIRGRYIQLQHLDLPIRVLHAIGFVYECCYREWGLEKKYPEEITVEDLRELVISRELLRFPNVGPVSFKLVEKKLAKLGVNAP